MGDEIEVSNLAKPEGSAVINEIINKNLLSQLKESKGKKMEPLRKHTLIYDTASAQIEPVYYWFLDFIKEKIGVDSLQKITDNFQSSPGSGQFSEMDAKSSKFRNEAMTLMGGLNQIIKSVLNLVYDLKEFEIRLKHYEDSKSKDVKIKESGMLALKLIWLDNVDSKRGVGSLNQLPGQFGYTTVREVFLIANSVEDLNKMAGKDGLINEQVKRLLIPRVAEFLTWIDYSEKELNKRYEIERSYLKSQVETVNLYSSWIRPYLKAANDLRMKGFDRDASLVNAFSTSMFEMVLLSTKKINIEKSVDEKTLPYSFREYKSKRNYYSCMVVRFRYRGHLGQKAGQRGDFAFAYGGRVQVDFSCYALNDEELRLIEKKLTNKDLEDSINMFQDTTSKSIEQLKDDIEYFTSDKASKDTETKEEKKEPENPFSALFSFKSSKSEKKHDKDKKKNEIKDLKDIKNDSYVENTLRELAAETAKKNLYAIYDIYKKAHGMASAWGEGFDA